jgi:SAM-dependent methyltransferase
MAILKPEFASPRAAELSILDQTVVTARSFDHLTGKGIIYFPDNGNGRKTLDIGGGGSDVTAMLFARGYDAYALDPRYKSRSDTKGRARNFLRTYLKQRPQDLNRQQHVRMQEEALERFVESFQENPDRYIAGFATDLSRFPDETFDYIVSVNSITEYLDIYAETLLASVSEAIRVTKPEGIIQIYPFNDAFTEAENPRIRLMHQIVHEKRLRNQSLLMQDLDTNPRIKTIVHPAGASDHDKLVIQKLS